MNTDIQNTIAELERAAAAHIDAGRMDDALGAAAEIQRLAPDAPDALGAAGTIAMRAGRRGEAARFFMAQMEALDQTGSGDAMAYNRLGHTLRNLNAPRLAINAFKRSANRAPQMVENHVLLADLLEKIGEYDVAETACQHALQLSPGNPDVMATLGVVMHRKGRPAEAADAYRVALAAHPEWDFLYNNLAAALMEAGSADELVSVCDAWLDRSPDDIEALSFKALALNEAGRRDEARQLLDFDRFVRTHIVAVPEGYEDLADFNTALEAHVLAHPTLATPPEDHPTWHHPRLQITEEILDGDKGPVADLERLMNEAISAYQEAVPQDPDHPFLANPPSDWTLSAWGAVLNGAGNQQPHIHEDGYLSGVYYIRIPDEVSSEENDEQAGYAGGFEVGRPPDELHCHAEPEIRAIRPYEGLMLLFPAFMYHRTIPFESDTKRICIAFDVVRK